VRWLSRIEDHEGRHALPHFGPARRPQTARSVPATPSWVAAFLIFEVNNRSSRTAKITPTMILETQAAGPFMKKGFVVGCERSREAVMIDPGDEVADLLRFAERNALTIRHILLTQRARRSRHRRGGREERARRAHLPPSATSLFLYERAAEMGRMFGLHVEPPAARRRVLFGWTGDSIRRVRGGDRITRPGHCPGGVCLPDSQNRGAGA